jgi:four helix bundle protein
MPELAYVNSYRDLIVYKKTRQMAKDIFFATLKFPEDEKFSLTSQVRRSSRSIGAQIAEAWAKRRYEKHFLSKLTDADGEQLETQHWIDTAVDCGYLDKAQAVKLLEQCLEIGRMLGSMIDKAPEFCFSSSHAIREIEAEYYENPDGV